MNDGTTVEWRTCGGCYHQYKGRFGECPKCCDATKKRSTDIGGCTGNRRGAPTLDIQEGNDDRW